MAPAPEPPPRRWIEPGHGLGSRVIDGRLFVAGGGPNPDLSVSYRLGFFTP
jgi:hypothetical protein